MGYVAIKVVFVTTQRRVRTVQLCSFLSLLNHFETVCMHVAEYTDKDTTLSMHVCIWGWGWAERIKLLV